MRDKRGTGRRRGYERGTREVGKVTRGEKRKREGRRCKKVQGEHKAVPGLITVTHQPGSGSFVIRSCTRLFSRYMNRLHGLYE